MDKNIIQLKDGLERFVNRGEYDRFKNETNEGIQSITQLTYSFDNETGFINVSAFDTGISINPVQSRIHDLRAGSTPFKQGRRRGTMGMIL